MVQLTPQDSEQHTATYIQEGSQVQIFPNDEWRTVVLIHQDTGGAKIVLHLCETLAKDDVEERLTLDHVMAIKQNKQCNMAISDSCLSYIAKGFKQKKR